MEVKKSDNKKEKLNIIVEGKHITLIFEKEPNIEAAEYIKQTLINAYLICK